MKDILSLLFFVLPFGFCRYRWHGRTYMVAARRGIFGLNKSFTRVQWGQRYEAQFFPCIALWLPLQFSLWEVPFVGTTLRPGGSNRTVYWREKTFGNELLRSKGDPQMRSRPINARVASNATDEISTSSRLFRYRK